MDKRCENCRAFVAVHGPEGECHRYAPRAAVVVLPPVTYDSIYNPYEEIETLWPPVDKGSFCLEFIPKC